MNYRKAAEDVREAGRWVPVQWGDTGTQQYTAALTITAEARQNLILDIVTALNADKVGVTSMNIRELSDGLAVAQLSVLVRDLATLQGAMRHLRGIRSVRDVLRPGTEEIKER